MDNSYRVEDSDRSCSFAAIARTPLQYTRDSTPSWRSTWGPVHRVAKNSATPNRNPKPDPPTPSHTPAPRRGAILALGVDNELCPKCNFSDP